MLIAVPEMVEQGREFKRDRYAKMSKNWGRLTPNPSSLHKYAYVVVVMSFLSSLGLSKE
jgi:hypothetical protein